MSQVWIASISGIVGKCLQQHIPSNGIVVFGFDVNVLGLTSESRALTSLNPNQDVK
jgi:hypothetical protein